MGEIRGLVNRPLKRRWQQPLGAAHGPAQVPVPRPRQALGLRLTSARMGGGQGRQCWTARASLSRCSRYPGTSCRAGGVRSTTSVPAREPVGPDSRSSSRISTAGISPTTRGRRPDRRHHHAYALSPAVRSPSAGAIVIVPMCLLSSRPIRSGRRLEVVVVAEHTDLPQSLRRAKDPFTCAPACGNDQQRPGSA